MSLRQTILSRGIPRPPGRTRCGPGGRDFSSLNWNEFFDRNIQIQVENDSFNLLLKGTSGPIFYMLHGGGYSGATWAQLAVLLSESIDCRIVAPDLRGHGDSHSEDEENLSKERQVSDISAIFNKYYYELSDFEENPPVCVVGHSMGGALAVHVVHAKLIPNTVGLVVIDVVEGSAMDALSSMQSVLRSRPNSFTSEENAIKWCLQSGATANCRSARVSMPRQIVKKDDQTYIWRIDLAKTSPFWPEWFLGLSQSFVNCLPPKLLVLAGVDRLDKDLMIAQMQGKFQTVMMPRSGHAIHEDLPDELANHLATFAVRNGFAAYRENARSTQTFAMPRLIP